MHVHHAHRAQRARARVLSRLQVVMQSPTEKIHLFRPLSPLFYPSFTSRSRATCRRFRSVCGGAVLLYRSTCLSVCIWSVVVEVRCVVDVWNLCLKSHTLPRRRALCWCVHTKERMHALHCFTCMWWGNPVDSSLLTDSLFNHRWLSAPRPV